MQLNNQKRVNCDFRMIYLIFMIFFNQYNDFNIIKIKVQTK
jgi:hypothetical protein